MNRLSFSFLLFVGLPISSDSSTREASVGACCCRGDTNAIGRGEFLLHWWRRSIFFLFVHRNFFFVGLSSSWMRSCCCCCRWWPHPFMNLGNRIRSLFCPTNPWMQNSIKKLDFWNGGKLVLVCRQSVVATRKSSFWRNHNPLENLETRNSIVKKMVWTAPNNIHIIIFPRAKSVV